MFPLEALEGAEEVATVIGTEAPWSSLPRYLWPVNEGSARTNLARLSALRKLTTVTLGPARSKSAISLLSDVRSVEYLHAP